MSSEENIKDVKIEELVEKLAEGFKESEEEDVTAEEESVVEEATAEEESEVEEATAEEESETEKAPEEEPTEESKEEPAEELTEESVSEEPVEEEPKKKLSKKVWAIIISAVVMIVALATVYFVMSSHYKNRFFMQTFVNGIDCSDMTIKEVEATLQKKVEEYVLTLVKIDGTSEQIKGTDIDIKYIGYQQIKEAFAEQNSYTWPSGLLSKRNIDAEILFEYSVEKLNEQIGKLECVNPEKQIVPVAATVVYQDGEFVIKEETYGTQIDVEKLSQVIHAGVAAIDTEISINGSGCYVQPKYTKNSPEVAKARDTMNGYLNSEITYSLDSVEVTLTRDTFVAWIYVDENMTPGVATDQAKAYAKTLSSKYNTPNRSGVITSPTGKQVTMQNAAYGRTVGTDSEAAQLVKEIQEGKKVTRSPIFSRQETPEGQYMWGNTYIEVDISEQYMWYIVNGAIALETDVVTGKKGTNDTPTGTYTILEKIKGKYLTGRIVNGKPLYRTWVDYWMRVTWSGIGFHDAGWQEQFGGDWYVNNGSHGCINMPPAKAAELYGMLSKGTPVVIHY